jgi:hypothetical protein
LPYKIDPNPTALACFPFPLPCATDVRLYFLAGFRRDPSTPSKFPQPTASPPPPLALRTDPIQPRPPYTGIASTPSRPSPEPPELDLTVDSTPPPPPRPIQVRRSHPQLPLVLMGALVSPVRRPFAGNGDAPPQPPHLPVVGPIPLSPVVHVHLQSVP